MPWLSIFMALLAWLSSDKSTPEARTKALLGAAVVGGGTYAVTHATDWGQANLGALDGVAAAGPATKVVTYQGQSYTVPRDQSLATDANGTILTNDDGTPKFAVSADPTANQLINGTTKVLTSWGGTGTAAVIGATALATTSSWQKYLPWIIGGVALLALR